MIPLSYAHFWAFFQLGVGMKSDEDNHGSVCAVSGVITPPREEERKKNHLIQLGGTQSYRQAKRWKN